MGQDQAAHVCPSRCQENKREWGYQSWDSLWRNGGNYEQLCPFFFDPEDVHREWWLDNKEHGGEWVAEVEVGQEGVSEVE